MISQIEWKQYSLSLGLKYKCTLISLFCFVTWMSLRYCMEIVIIISMVSRWFHNHIIICNWPSFLYAFWPRLYPSRVSPNEAEIPLSFPFSDFPPPYTTDFSTIRDIAQALKGRMPLSSRTDKCNTIVLYPVCLFVKLYYWLMYLKWQGIREGESQGALQFSTKWVYTILIPGTNYPMSFLWSIQSQRGFYSNIKS